MVPLIRSQFLLKEIGPCLQPYGLLSQSKRRVTGDTRRTERQRSTCRRTPSLSYERPGRRDPIYPRAQSKADHPKFFRSKSPTSGRHRGSTSFCSSGARIVASMGHADCQQSFVVYHFEFRDSSLSVLFIRRQTRPRTVFSQPPLCHLVAKVMETDGRDEDSYPAV
jgi:hypothetical protein